MGPAPGPRPLPLIYDDPLQGYGGCQLCGCHHAGCDRRVPLPRCAPFHAAAPRGAAAAREGAAAAGCSGGGLSLLAFGLMGLQAVLKGGTGTISAGILGAQSWVAPGLPPSPGVTGQWRGRAAGTARAWHGHVLIPSGPAGRSDGRSGSGRGPHAGRTIESKKKNGRGPGGPDADSVVPPSGNGRR
eukprot:gene18441-biopygen6913